MIIVKLTNYAEKRYHRMFPNGTLACGSDYRRATSVDDTILPIRQLCGNCFKVKRIMVSVHPDHREVDLVTVGK